MILITDLGKACQSIITVSGGHGHGAVGGVLTTGQSLMFLQVLFLRAQLQRGAETNEEHKRGLTKEDILKHKIITYKKAKKNEDDVCSICLVTAKNGERLYELPCKHLFHPTCINPWFEKSTVCPNCRRDL